LARISKTSHEPNFVRSLLNQSGWSISDQSCEPQQVFPSSENTIKSSRQPPQIFKDAFWNYIWR